jgi:hypothetical protein
MMLPNGFARDDLQLLQRNPGLSDARSIWLTGWAAAAPVTDDRRIEPFYRPLTLFTIAAQSAVFGDQPFGFRVINLLLHATACGLVWVFARRLLGDAAIATVAAVLFAVHPVHTDSLGQIAGLAELLSATFILVGLILLLPASGSLSSRRAAAAAAAFLLALLSHEIALCYPAVAVVIVWARSRTGPPALRPGDKLRVAAILAVPLLAYLPLRWAALDGQRELPTSSVTADAETAPGNWERIHEPLTLLGGYAMKVLAPVGPKGWGQGLLDPSAGPNALTLLGAIASAGILAAAGRWLWALIRVPASLAPRDGIARPIGLMAAVFLASFPFLFNALTPFGMPMDARLFYWPSVWVMIAASVAVVRLWRTRRVGGVATASSVLLAGGVGLVTLLLAVVTVMRCWKFVDH